MKRFVLLLAILLTLGCAKTIAQETYQDKKCFTFENRTNIHIRMAICKENGEFFFAEQFQPMEIKQYCGPEVGMGTYIFCWQEMTTLSLDCMSFTVEEKHLPTLYDDVPDIWVGKKNPQSA